MIRVEVEDYCQQCMDFSPDVMKPDRSWLRNGRVCYEVVAEAEADTIIRCEYRKRCAGIRRFLEQQMKGEQES